MFVRRRLRGKEVRAGEEEGGCEGRGGGGAFDCEGDEGVGGGEGGRQGGGGCAEGGVAGAGGRGGEAEDEEEAEVAGGWGRGGGDGCRLRVSVLRVGRQDFTCCYELCERCGRDRWRFVCMAKRFISKLCMVYELFGC